MWGPTRRLSGNRSAGRGASAMGDAPPQPGIQHQGQGAVPGAQLNTYAQAIVNVAQLRGLVGLSTMLVIMEGFTTVGDGGQGAFVWNSLSASPDDNGVT